MRIPVEIDETTWRMFERRCECEGLTPQLVIEEVVRANLREWWGFNIAKMADSTR